MANGLFLDIMCHLHSATFARIVVKGCTLILVGLRLKEEETVRSKYTNDCPLICFCEHLCLASGFAFLFPVSGLQCLMVILSKRTSVICIIY